jgi:hypothetical protein
MEGSGKEQHLFSLGVAGRPERGRLLFRLWVRLDEMQRRRRWCYWQPQRVERIARLVKIERWKGKKIEACFHQLRMTDHDFDTVFELLLLFVCGAAASTRRCSLLEKPP